jgi:hypothetical protein
MTKIFVFGNEDLEMDSLPLRILSKLEKEFPKIEFEIKDPNEEWVIPESGELTILDTAVGIKEVTIFSSLEKFSKAPRVSMHDFDALTNLRYLQKLGKIKKIKIIALPPHLSEERAIEEVKVMLSS